MDGFEGLDAYRRAVALADEIRRCVEGWESFDLWTVGVQVVRAADSVGANIAEAYGRWNYPDRRRLLFVAARENGRLLNGLAKSWSP